MLKFVHLIGFFLIYLSASGQKAFFYKNSSCDLNKFSYFYMLNSPLDVHDITSPYIIKSDFDHNKNLYFMLYNEASLKNLTILDGESQQGTILMKVYEANVFDELTKAPKDYKRKKLKNKHLIIDMFDGSDNTLIWRGWTDLKKIKGKNDYAIYQKAISVILNNFDLEPTIIE